MRKFIQMAESMGTPIALNRLEQLPAFAQGFLAMHGLSIRCQILEVPTLDDTTPRDEGIWPRDLLPWADPYIASLMMNLQRKHGAAERLLDDDFTLDQFAAEQWTGDAWRNEKDADWPDLSAREEYPPIYGGFPLLEDE
jgi:hypothetical protein